MNLEQAVNRLRVLLSSQNEIQESTTEIQFDEAELVDGSIVKTEGSIEVGKQLLVVTPEGDIPAPEGQHQTTTNLLITVDADGIITAIEPIEEEVVEQKSEFNAEDFVVTVSELITPLKEEIASLKEQLKDVKVQFNAFKEEPAGKKITNNIKNNEFQASSLVDAKMQKILAIRNGKKLN